MARTRVKETVENRNHTDFLKKGLIGIIVVANLLNTTLAILVLFNEFSSVKYFSSLRLFELFLLAIWTLPSFITLFIDIVFFPYLLWKKTITVKLFILICIFATFYLISLPKILMVFSF